MKIRMVPLLFALPACGQLAQDDNTERTIATFPGTLTNSAGIELSAPVRVGVVWLGLDEDGDPTLPVARQVNSVAVTPEFPAGFQIHFTDTPPAEALVGGAELRRIMVFDACWTAERPEEAFDNQCQSELRACLLEGCTATEFRAVCRPTPPAPCLVELESRFAAGCPADEFQSACQELQATVHALPSDEARMAVGRVVVFEDLNGNEQLDLIEPGQAPIDRVLGGASQNLFFQSGLTGVYADERAELAEGYSLIEAGVARAERIEVDLTDHPRVQREACREVNGFPYYDDEEHYEVDALEGGAPALPENGTCVGNTYVTETCDTGEGTTMCGWVECHVRSWTPATSETPFEWPCETE